MVPLYQNRNICLILFFRLESLKEEIKKRPWKPWCWSIPFNTSDKLSFDLYFTFPLHLWNSCAICLTTKNILLNIKNRTIQRLKCYSNISNGYFVLLLWNKRKTWSPPYIMANFLSMTVNLFNVILINILQTI